MNELNQAASSPIDGVLERYYSTPTPDAAFSAELADLLRSQHTQLRKAKAVQPKISPWAILRMRPVLALVLALLAILAISGAVYALGKLTGFIPGFGFTSGDAPVSMLAQPTLISSGRHAYSGRTSRQ